MSDASCRKRKRLKICYAFGCTVLTRCKENGKICILSALCTTAVLKSMTHSATGRQTNKGRK